MAPAGTITESCEVLATVTVAFTAPKKTRLSAGIEAKLFPLIVIVVPAYPAWGLKLIMNGGWEFAEKVKKTQISPTIAFNK